MSANEDASVLRKRGKLAAARVSLEACNASSCPQVIRDDCAKLLEEVNSVYPSLILKVVEGGTTPITNVKVLMDNEPFADHLDGKAIEVEPGLHEFKFFALNHDTKTWKIILREGLDRNRAETIDLGGAPVVTSGRLDVKAEPGAAIFFDGAPAAAPTLWPLPGHHTIRVTKNGKIPSVVDVEMKGGETSLDVKLESEKPSMLPWIIGGAIVLAGLLIGGGIAIAASGD